MLCISCQNEAENNSFIANNVNKSYTENGFDIVFKSINNPVFTKNGQVEQEQFSFSISNEDVTIEGILIKDNISQTAYNIEHYNIDNELIATLVVEKDTIIDVIINEEYKQKYKDCLVQEYEKYKEFYDHGTQGILCDLADIFAGCCTVTGIVQAAIRCMFK